MSFFNTCFNTLIQLYMQARLFDSAFLKIEEQLQKNVQLNIPSATRFLTIFDKKHNKCKFKSRLLGHSNGGRKNTYTSTYTRVGSTYHIWSRSKHIYPICFSKISFKYAILMKFDRQIEHHKNFEKVCPCLFQHQYFFAEVSIFKHFGKIFQNSPV